MSHPWLQYSFLHTPDLTGSWGLQNGSSSLWVVHTRNMLGLWSISHRTYISPDTECFLMKCDHLLLLLMSVKTMHKYHHILQQQTLRIWSFFIEMHYKRKVCGWFCIILIGAGSNPGWRTAFPAETKGNSDLEPFHLITIRPPHQLHQHCTETEVIQHLSRLKYCSILSKKG